MPHSSLLSMFDEFGDEDEYLEAGEDAAADSAGSLPPPRENPDLLGHDEIEKTLLSLFNNNTLPHAMIFAGPSGIGKMTMAYRFARFLLRHGNQEEEQDSLFGDAPAKPSSMMVASDDPVFRKVASGGHPDLRTVERPIDDRKGTQKGTVDIESARKIAPFLRMSASDGGWRVVIVDEADLMTRQAQNAVLKILEEPPPRAVLILICNRLGAMIPTIRSRCRVIHFAPLAPDAVSMLLKRAATGAVVQDIALITDLADGSIGQALDMQEEGGIATLHTLLAFFSDWPNWNWAKIHPWADNLSRPDADRNYRSFAFFTQWACGTLLRAKAVPGRKLPDILKNEALQRLLDHYSLEQWITLCERLQEHFTAIDVSNLDKRQGVLGAFAIIGGQTG